MTKHNFTEVALGFYRTRGGVIAEVVQIMDARLKDNWPARGLIGTHIYSWTTTGLKSVTQLESHLDLIEYLGTEKPCERRARTETLTRLANIYEGRDDVATFATKKHADLRAGPGRIVCVELTGEYEVEVTE